MYVCMKMRRNRVRHSKAIRLVENKWEFMKRSANANRQIGAVMDAQCLLHCYCRVHASVVSINYHLVQMFISL